MTEARGLRCEQAPWPNSSLERSAQRRCRWVPAVLRTPAPAQLCRWAS